MCVLDANAGAGHLEDHGVVDKAVDRRRGGIGSLKIRSHSLNTRLLVMIGDDHPRTRVLDRGEREGLRTLHWQLVAVPQFQPRVRMIEAADPGEPAPGAGVTAHKHGWQPSSPGGPKRSGGGAERLNDDRHAVFSGACTNFDRAQRDRSAALFDDRLQSLDE